MLDSLFWFFENNGIFSVESLITLWFAQNSQWLQVLLAWKPGLTWEWHFHGLSFDR